MQFLLEPSVRRVIWFIYGAPFLRRRSSRQRLAYRQPRWQARAQRRRSTLHTRHRHRSASRTGHAQGHMS